MRPDLRRPCFLAGEFLQNNTGGGSVDLSRCSSFGPFIYKDCADNIVAYDPPVFVISDFVYCPIRLLPVWPGHHAYVGGVDDSRAQRAFSGQI